MSQAARITLFVHDRGGWHETLPDLDRLHVLVQQPPLITRHEDGSRTFVFDLVDQEQEQEPVIPRTEPASMEALRRHCAELARMARALGLPLTAALADSADLVVEGELRGMQVAKNRQC